MRACCRWAAATASSGIAANNIQHSRTRCRGDSQPDAGADDQSDGRVKRVRVRFRGHVWERTLDWDEIALVRELSPGRDPNAALRSLVTFV